MSTFGVLVPAGTPNDVLARLNTEIAKIMQNTQAKEQMLEQGVYALQPQTPDKAAGACRLEVTRWSKLINDAGIKADD